MEDVVLLSHIGGVVVKKHDGFAWRSLSLYYLERVGDTCQS